MNGFHNVVELISFALRSGNNIKASMVFERVFGALCLPQEARLRCADCFGIKTIIRYQCLNAWWGHSVWQ